MSSDFGRPEIFWSGLQTSHITALAKGLIQSIQVNE
jgi:hypothetical protein